MFSFKWSLVIWCLVMPTVFCLSCKKSGFFNEDERFDCPRSDDDSSESFCCDANTSSARCCDIHDVGDTVYQTMMIVFGVFIVVTVGLCIMCFACPFCWIAKQRKQRQGNIIRSGPAHAAAPQQAVQFHPAQYPPQATQHPIQATQYPTQPGQQLPQPFVQYPQQPVQNPQGFYPYQASSETLPLNQGSAPAYQPYPYEQKQPAFNPNAQ